MEKRKVCEEPANFPSALSALLLVLAGPAQPVWWSPSPSVVVSVRPHLVAKWDSSIPKQSTPFTLNKSSKSTKKIQSLKMNEIYQLWLGK